MKSKRERRRSRRRFYSVPVREIAPGMQVLLASDVSEGGLFCPWAGPREIGATVVLEIDLLNDDEPLRIPARVVSSGVGPSGVGVGFKFDRRVPEIVRFVDEAPGFEDVPSC